MKQLALILGIVALSVGRVHATYTILRDAGNLSRGILPNERLDRSSVTLMGNQFNQLGSLLRPATGGSIGTYLGVNGPLAVNGIFTSTMQAQVVITSHTTNATSANTNFLQLYNPGFSAGRWLFQGVPSAVNADTLDLSIAPVDSNNSQTQNTLYMTASSGKVKIGGSIAEPSSKLDVTGGSVTIRTSAGQGGLAITGAAGSAENLLVVSTGTKQIFVVNSTSIVCGVDLARQGSVYNNPDYVFEPDYQYYDLETLQAFVAANKHLPGMKSTAEVERDGVQAFGQIRALQEKLEEAYLYIFELDKRLKLLETGR